MQQRPSARALDDAAQRRAQELFRTTARGNAKVVQRLLQDEGIEVSLRSVQRAVVEARREQAVASVATTRFETEPGQQMQIDFGQLLVCIAGELVRVFFLVAVLGFSRRLFVKTFLSERHDDWREGVARAFRHFGGVPRDVLGDNAGALVVTPRGSGQEVVFHPAWKAFCEDWQVTPKACAPYRARTKGKTESGVKFVKRNAIAGRVFDSIEGLNAHLDQWMREADARVHGTTHERPIDRFERAERAALRALPTATLPIRERRLKRKVSSEAMVHVDTVQYSVPHKLIGLVVEVLVGLEQVSIFRGADRIALHPRCCEPRSRVTDRAHHAGLFRSPVVVQPSPDATTSQDPLSRYQDVVQAGGAT